MPREVIYALAMIKIAAARANRALCPLRMTEEKLFYIERVGEEILSGARDGQFPLSVFQTGRGTQTNMNVNEVIANRANELFGARLLHPNDDVNMSQSSNDTFPAAMHVSAVLTTLRELIPALDELIDTLSRLEEENREVYKSGRTHLQDATPITFGQEISGWRASLTVDREMIIGSLSALRSEALGATAVGTGINAPKGFDLAVAKELSTLAGECFYPAENKCHALSSKGELVTAHGALKALAADLMKIANDIRFLASGPRTGLSEITIPENEPGSSIMPGKVNPTQCEAVTMVAVQVMANDTAIGMSASQGNFELNVFMPVLINNYLQSVALLADVCRSFNKNCVSGIRANRSKMRENLDRSLMNVTALSPLIGYEAAARVAKLANEKNLTIREVCLSLGILNEEQLDEALDPSKMV